MLKMPKHGRNKTQYHLIKLPAAACGERQEKTRRAGAILDPSSQTTHPPWNPIGSTFQTDSDHDMPHLSHCHQPDQSQPRPGSPEKVSIQSPRIYHCSQEPIPNAALSTTLLTQMPGQEATSHDVGFLWKENQGPCNGPHSP